MLTKRIWGLGLLVALGLSAMGCNPDGTCKLCHPAKEEPKPEKPYTLAPPKPVETGMCSTWLAFPTGSKATSALLLEKSAPCTVQVGQNFDYWLTCTNLTSGVLHDVVVTETLPNNFKMASSDPAGDGGKWALHDLGPGESRKIKVTGSASAPGALTNCATATYNQNACLTIQVLEPPKLTLVKQMPATALLCENIPVTFTVTNTGKSPASGVQITDTLPAGLAGPDGKNTVTFDVGPLGPGQSATRNATVRASKTGSYSNGARATGAGGLSADATAVTTKVVQPVLSITKTANDAEFVSAETTYTITVKNVGDAAAPNVTVTDTIPAGITFLSAQGGEQRGNLVTWGVGTLQPNDSKSYTVKVRGDAIGKVTNTATVQATCAESKTASKTIEFKGIPALLLEMDDIGGDPVRVGNNTTYHITVTNQGSDKLTNVKVELKFDDGQKFVSGQGDTAVTAAGNGATIESVKELAPHGKDHWNIVVNAVNRGQKSFTVKVTSDQITNPLSKSETTNFYNDADVTPQK